MRALPWQERQARTIAMVVCGLDELVLSRDDRSRGSTIDARTMIM
jgi:hypothetical protein